MHLCAQLASVYSAPAYIEDVAGGFSQDRRCMMGGSAAPGWSRSSLSRTLVGYF